MNPEKKRKVKKRKGKTVTRMDIKYKVLNINILIKFYPFLKVGKGIKKVLNKKKIQAVRI